MLSGIGVSAIVLFLLFVILFGSLRLLRLGQDIGSRSQILKLCFGLFSLAALGCRTACPPSAREGLHLGPVPGPEDFEVQVSGPGAPALLVSSQARRSDKEPKPGQIIAIPLVEGQGKATPKSLDLTERGNCSFHPHGISLVNEPSGRPILYVINHHGRHENSDCLRGPKVIGHAGTGKKVHSVEEYEPEGDGWKMRRRLLDPNLTNPNDLAALADGTIYLTNAPAGTIHLIYEALIGNSSSRIVAFDGQSWHRVAFRPRNANGIAVDWARRRLYVAETARKRINVFALDGTGEAMAPTKIEEIPVGSGVDNLSWGPEGPEGRTLWVAAHRSLFAFARLSLAWKNHRKDKPYSPSEVYRISLSGDSGTSKRVFYDDGRHISGASIAFPFDGSLFIGQVFDEFVLRYPFQ